MLPSCFATLQYLQFLLSLLRCLMSHRGAPFPRRCPGKFWCWTAAQPALGSFLIKCFPPACTQLVAPRSTCSLSLRSSWCSPAQLCCRSTPELKLWKWQHRAAFPAPLGMILQGSKWDISRGKGLLCSALPCHGSADPLPTTRAVTQG